jgi:carboxyl-terminal processing protease
MLPIDPDHATPPASVDASQTGDTELEAEPVRRVAHVTIPPVLLAGPPSRTRGGPVLAIAIVLVAVLGAGALFMAGYQLGVRTTAEPGTPATLDEEFKPFWDAWNAVTKRYAGGPIDEQKLIEGAIRGLVEAVGDPYSSYLSADEFRQTLQDVSGEFEGIGAEIGTVDAARDTVDCSEFGPDCRLVIVAPLEGSPAQKAGLKPGDIVDAVDGKSIDGLSPDQARDRIRGKKGTEVTLSIDREGAAPFDVTVTRDVIVTREVIAEDLVDGTVGYIRLTGFSEHGADQFTAALKEDVDAGRTRIIVDLRGNPGGFITAAREVASQFIGSGPVFWQEDADGEQTPTEAVKDGVATDEAIRVVLLIDRGSASASEIVAGALQDTKRATLVGETTFGKGTVQQWEELNGAGGIKLTIAKWLTPNKRWVHHVGITPDVAVTVPDGTPAGEDLVLEKALEILAESVAATFVMPRAA